MRLRDRHWQLASLDTVRSNLSHRVGEDRLGKLTSLKAKRSWLTWFQKFYFVFASFNIVITIPTIWFLFAETNKKSLEEIDLLFGERALGTLPEQIETKDVEDAIRRGSTIDEKNIEVSQARVAAEHNEKI